MKKYHKTVLDSLWSRIVRTRDEFRCRRCHTKHSPRSMGLHAHHLVTKGGHGFSTRWNVDNGVAVCYGCHMYLQGNPKENRDFAINLGIDYDELDILGKTTVKVFYPEKREELEKILTDMDIVNEMRRGDM